MKNIFLKSIALFTALLLAVSSSFIISAEPTDADISADTVAATDNMETMLENDKFELSFNKENGSAALKNKATGYVWYTNPTDIGEEKGTLNAKLKSQFFVYYYSNKILTEMDSYSFGTSVGNKLEFTNSKNSISVKYTLGKEVIVKEMMPQVISKERMEKEVLSKLNKEQKEKLLGRYKLYEKDKLADDTLETLKVQYPVINKHDFYLRQSIPPYLLRGIYECFKAADYTFEDLEKDCEENGIENTYMPDPHFVIVLTYKLNDDGLSVSVDTEKIEYYDNYKPVQVCILPYFGASGVEETGYMLVPDGSGAIIEFNNGKIKEDNYWKEFFGADKVYNKKTADTASQDSLLPVFAMSNSKAGYLATVTSGYENAGVCADIAGRLNNYNYMYPFFNIFNYELVSLTNNSLDQFMLYSSEPLSDNIQVDYHITDTPKTYSEFALMYRDILKKDKVLPTGNKVDVSVLDVNFLGVTTVSKRFLGVPYETTDTFTTYKQAVKILEKLEGIKIDANYTSALKGGIKQTSANRVQFASKLGSKKELNALKKAANNLSVDYYAQSAAKIGKDDRIIGFGGGFARNVRYNVISGKAEESTFFMVSPTKLEKYADSTVKSLSKLNGITLNLLDLGYVLTSDFNEKNEIDRCEANDYVQKYLKKLSAKVKLSAEKGSYYSLPYLSKIASIPTDISGYGIEDYAVPFYQIVVSGSLDYSAAPINNTKSAREQFLKAVEIGARLQYTWYYEKPDDITNTYENYYGYNYKSTLEQASEYSKEYSSLAKKISGSKITEHTRFSPTLAKTEWENGTVVYVNYADAPQTVEGVTVEAQSFSAVN